MRRLPFVMLAALAVLAGLTGCSSKSPGEKGSAPKATKSFELLNVSYDPTRELWRELNDAFKSEQAQKGVEVDIKQSHGGSSSQARAVIDGLPADVVTLALWGDTDAIRKAGLINEGWDERLPNGSLPYSSTIVFVVRKGNPKKIADWKDLLQDGVEVITPSPKTSGNGKLSFLSAWGNVILNGGSEKDALEFVTELYKHVPVLDQGARGATATFAQKQIGDVHLTWENEAHLEVAEAKGDLELVYPPRSIRAEPRVAVVDANVDRQGSREVAEAYLEFLYTPAAQDIIAKHHYRPAKPEALKAHSGEFPKIELFSIKDIVPSWSAADEKFFAADGVFDGIYKK